MNIMDIGNDSKPIDLEKAKEVLEASAPAGWKVSLENFGVDLGNMVHMVHIDSNTHIPIGAAGEINEEWAEVMWVFALDYFESGDDYLGEAPPKEKQ